MASNQPSDPAASASGEPPVPARDEETMERRGLAAEIGEASFPVSLRGYNRAAVDDYVSRVEQVVAELELKRSPETAVKRALEQVGEQTRTLLKQAGLTAEEVVTAARHDAEGTIASANEEAEQTDAKAKAAAEDILARSKEEAEATVAQARMQAAEERERCQADVTSLREEAEARVRELRADTDTIHQERSGLLTDIREITTRVEQIASAADVRFPPPEAEQPGDANLHSEVADGAAEGAETTAEESTEGRQSRPQSPS